MPGPAPEVSRALRALPNSPGVYIFKDAGGEVIYIGKALSLRKRAPHHFKEVVPFMTISEHTDEVASVEYIETRTETEALFLEANLIKRHQPRYNVTLKDDKRYPFIKLSREAFPRISVVREEVCDEAEYFGPFGAAAPTKATVNMIQRMLGLRVCRRMNPRGCLYMHIGMCSAPCVGSVDEEAYAARVARARLMLRGDTRELSVELERQMRTLSAEERFEEAADIRDYMRDLERMMEAQSVHLVRDRDDDYLAHAALREIALVFVLQVRGGKVVDKRLLRLQHAGGVPAAEALAAAIPQLYRRGGVPRTVMVPEAIPDQRSIELALTQKAGRRVHLQVPSRGQPLRLMKLAVRNAGSYARTERLRRQLRVEDAGTEALAAALRLEGPPSRIEAFDVSHHQGDQAVASMVVFVDGRPLKRDYRRFRVRTAEPGDDYQAMREVVSRRYGGSLAPKLPPPDLVLVDGGPGQLAAASEALGTLGATHAVAALAKEREELYVPGSREPLPLEPDSDAILLLRRVRDEAHRFAVSHHRGRRRRALTRSRLSDVPGMGPVRTRSLLVHFGSLKAVTSASLEELKAAPGIGPATAAVLWEALHGGEGGEGTEGEGGPWMGGVKGSGKGDGKGQD